MTLYTRPKTGVVSFVNEVLPILEIKGLPWTMTIEPAKSEVSFVNIVITDLLVDGERKTSMYLEELLSTWIGHI